MDGGGRIAALHLQCCMGVDVKITQMYEFHKASLEEFLCPSRRLGRMGFSTVSAVIEMQDVPARSSNDRVNFLVSTDRDDAITAIILGDCRYQSRL
jgi:hypothetical protein